MAGENGNGLLSSYVSWRALMLTLLPLLGLLVTVDSRLEYKDNEVAVEFRRDTRAAMKEHELRPHAGTVLKDELNAMELRLVAQLAASDLRNREARENLAELVVTRMATNLQTLRADIARTEGELKSIKELLTRLEGRTPSPP